MQRSDKQHAIKWHNITGGLHTSIQISAWYTNIITSRKWWIQVIRIHIWSSQIFCSNTTDSAPKCLRFWQWGI